MALNGARDPGGLRAAGVAIVALAVVTGSVLAFRSGLTDPALGERPPAAASPVPSEQPDGVPAESLLPNLRVLPAEELGIGGRGDRRTLRFASVLFNAGDGALEVRPLPGEQCPAGQRHVTQRVYLDSDGDGKYLSRRDTAGASLPGGCMVFHPGHDHWHFDSSAGYALTALDDDVPIVARDKVSFCLRDSEPAVGPSGRQVRAYEECARNRRQGISVGWADRYDASLPGQRLALPPGLADGPYCLRLTVDPFDLLRETDEGDNTSATVVRITGREVERDRTLSC